MNGCPRKRGASSRIADRSNRNFLGRECATYRIGIFVHGGSRGSSLSAAAGRERGSDPYSGCHGDRVETVSRGREPSAIRDPAKWTVPSTYGYCKVKLVYTHPILPEAPFKPLSTIHDYRLNVRLKKRFRRGH